MRSLFLNYEVMALLYGKREVNLMADWFRLLAATCDDGLPSVGRLRIAAEDVAHLFSPLA
jgi:hypothetical protein